MLQSTGSVDRVVALATGLFRFCPVYPPFGLSTCAANSGTTVR